MLKAPILSNKTTKGHAFFLYDTAESRLSLLAEYFKQGLANNELCILVTPEPASEALQDFKAIGFDAGEAYNNHSLRIFEMNSTYLPDGNFVSDYMLNNVKEFINEATAKGFDGIRTAGEMSWLADNPGSVADSLRYEHDVNYLHTPDIKFTGLCLYTAQNAFTQLLNGVMHSHPTYIDDGRAIANPHYSAT